MTLFRRILFFVLAAVYVVVCPLLVLYALGYIYSPKKGELTRTGLLRIETVPAGAEIRLVDAAGEDVLKKRLFTYHTPAQIERLDPCEYTITLNKDGFKSWSQPVTIEAGRAAVFENVLLIPEVWQANTLTQFSCSRIVPVKNRDFFLASRGDKLDNFFVCDRKNEIQVLTDSNSLFASLVVEDFYCAAGSDKFIVYGSGKEKKYVLLDVEGREPLITDISKLVGQKVSLITWQNDDTSRLYTLSDNSIGRIDVKKGYANPSIISGVKGFDVFKDWIYVLDQNGFLSRYRQAGQIYKRDELSADTSVSGRLFDKSDFYRITVSQEGIFFLGSQGDFVTSLPPYTIAAGGVRDFEFRQNSAKLLYYGKNFIGIADYSSRAEKSTFWEKFRILNAVSNGRDIKQAFWVLDDWHIIYNDGGTIKLVEIEPQGPNHKEEIVKVKEGTDIFYNDRNYTLYYIDSKSGLLSEIKIITEPSLIRILTRAQ